MRKLLLLFSFFLLNFNSFSQLTTNTFTGASACPTNGNTFSSVNNATVTPLSRNTIVCTPAGNVFNSNTLNLTASRNDNSYIEFSITANSGYGINLTSLSFFRQGSNTAPNSLIVSYSTDANAANFNSTRVDMAVSTTASAGTVLTWTFPSTVTTPSGGKVTFRFYPFGTVSVNGGTPAAGGTFRLDDVSLFGSIVPASPTLSVTPTSLTNLTYVSGSTTSPAQSYTLSGSALTSSAPIADTITVKAPADFEVSKTSSTTGFADSLKVIYTTTTLAPTQIYVRLKLGLPVNTYGPLDIKHKGGGVSSPPTVSLSGSVTDLPPPVITTTGTLTAFSTFIGNPSASQSYTVSGINLVSDITITAPTGFQIKTGAGAYATSLILTPTSGSVPTTTIDVYMPATPVGSFSGNITHASTNLSPSVNVAVTGTVVAACATPTAISTVRSGIPEQGTYTGTVSTTIAGRVSARYGNNKFYLQDATGGIAVFSSYNGGVAQSNGIVVGDSVIVTGVTARFNGESELVPPTSTSTAPFTCINRIAGSGASTTPALFVFDSNNPPTGVNLATFLDVNEGRRVKIISANFITTGNFAASTNYSISACNGQGDSEIRIDVAASQTVTGTPIPTVTQDITGVIGHYITATGTVNILQIFPSSPADFSSSAVSCAVVIPTSAASCGPLAATITPVDSTLDVTAWNVEWLGNTTSSPSALGPINDAQQMTNVLTVLNATKADVFCIEEVCDHNQFIARVGTDLPGYGVSCQTAYYSHFFDTPEVAGNATTYSQKVCFVYKTAIVSPVNAEIKSLLSDVYTYTPPTGPNNWASGRLPYLFVANVTLGGITKKIHFVGLHAKSGSALADYNRRKQDIIDLKAKLDTDYANANIIMLGDYNDDLDTSIAASQPSSYKNFVTDNVRYNQISKALSDCQVSSTAKYPDIIDHFMTSNEIGLIPDNNTNPVPSISDIYYLEKTINVSRPINYVVNYTTSTSDHYPVNARFKFGLPPVKVASLTSGNWSSPSTWNCNCVPTSANDVIIETGHTVTVDVASQAKSLNLKGTLNWISDFSLSLGM